MDFFDNEWTDEYFRDARDGDKTPEPYYERPLAKASEVAGVVMNITSMLMLPIIIIGAILGGYVSFVGKKQSD